MNSSGIDISPRPLASEFSAAPGETPAAGSVNRRPAGQPRRRVPAAAGHSPGPGAAAGRGLCGAGPLAAYSPRLVRRSRGRSAHHAGRPPGEPVWPRGGDCRGGAEGQAA